MPTAILVDGDFFLKRYRDFFGKQSPEKVASDLHKLSLSHLDQGRRPRGEDYNGSAQGYNPDRRDLYRIFFYDCPPLAKKVHHPLTGELVDFSKTGTYQWRTDFHNALRRLRKTALRLGELNDRSGLWQIKPRPLKELLDGDIEVEDLHENDIRYNIAQKGVDMRVGMDIATMAFKRLVDQIILIAGDSDFVPAAKLARREGVDFVLDPLWSGIHPDLFEHIDGLRSIWKRPHQDHEDDEDRRGNEDPQPGNRLYD